MPNITEQIKRDALEKKIKEYIGKDIFDIHYGESDNCEVKHV